MANALALTTSKNTIHVAMEETSTKIVLTFFNLLFLNNTITAKDA